MGLLLSGLARREPLKAPQNHQEMLSEWTIITRAVFKNLNTIIKEAVKRISLDRSILSWVLKRRCLSSMVQVLEDSDQRRESLPQVLAVHRMILLCVGGK